MNQTRKEFINTLFRGLILTGIVGIGGYLVLRKGSSENDSCSFDFVCKDCKKLKSCNIPEAVQFKKQGSL